MAPAVGRRPLRDRPAAERDIGQIVAIEVLSREQVATRCAARLNLRFVCDREQVQRLPHDHVVILNGHLGDVRVCDDGQCPQGQIGY